MKHNRINKMGIWSLLLCIPFALVGCDHNVHGNEPDGLSVALAWQNPTAADTIKDIRLWAYNAADGTKVIEKQYADVRELASDSYQLSDGTYRVLTVVNLKSPLSITNTSNLNELLLSLSDANASPEHVWYSVAEAKMGATRSSELAADTLRRALAELTVTIENAPDSMTFTGTLTNAATGINLGVKSADGTYGVANNTQAIVTLPSATTQGTIIQTETMRLMPTEGNGSKSHFLFLLTNAEGHANEFEIEAPVMKPGGKYQITLDYRTMRAFMSLSTNVINSWTEGGSNNGEILNPDK